jgi:hypothetical protein
MPRLFARNEKQFIAQEVNKSRLVTKIWWAVEGVNGQIKKVFHLFWNTISNHYIGSDKLRRFLRIGCAMLNAL